jgi:hypothetical protein
MDERASAIREGKTSMSDTRTGDRAGLRRVTGWLLVIGAVSFAIAATVLSSTFDWPDILREPPEVVLPAFVDGGTSLVWTWFAVAWTYAILLVPILLLPAALGRREDPALGAATFVGAASVLLSLIGFLRWVFVVPALADSYIAGDPTTKAAVAAARLAQHQFGGALLGEHLGQLLAIGWSITVSVLILRTGILWRWVGWTGLVASLLQPHERHATAGDLRDRRHRPGRAAAHPDRRAGRWRYRTAGSDSANGAVKPMFSSRSTVTSPAPMVRRVSTPNHSTA